MRSSLSRLIFTVLTTCGASIASADSNHNRYKWHDATGALHYADVLPAEAAKYGYEVVNAQGIVVKRVERAKTATELAAAKTAAAQERSIKNAADERARSDDQLISGYPEEADLKHAQQQSLETLDQQIFAAQISLRSQEQVLADLLGRAAEDERNKKAIPEAQAAQLAKLRKQVDDQRAAVERRQSERNNATSVFDAETLHYRELKAKRSAPQDGH